MKTTLNTNDIADALRRDENANWSNTGARALAEYLEEYEDGTGEELELDVCALRCDFAEYSSLKTWRDEYFGSAWGELGLHTAELERATALEKAGEIADAEQIRRALNDELDEKIREYIQDHGQLIEFDGGIIVSSF